MADIGTGVIIHALRLNWRWNRIRIHLFIINQVRGSKSVLLLVVLRTQALVQFDQVIANFRYMLSFPGLLANMYLLLPLKPKHLFGGVFQSLLLLPNRFKVKRRRLFVLPSSYFRLLVSQTNLLNSVIEIKSILTADFEVGICVVWGLGVDSGAARQRLWCAYDLLLGDFGVCFLDAYRLVHVEIEPHFVGRLLGNVLLSSRRPGLVAH